MPASLWTPIENNQHIGLLADYLKLASPSGKILNSFSYPTPFYKDTFLLKAELLNKDNSTEWFYALCKNGMYIHPLDFTNTPIYSFNEKTGIVVSKETVCAYVDFFFGHVKGRHGFFHILHSIDDIPMDKEKAASIVFKEVENEPEAQTAESDTPMKFDFLVDALNYFIQDVKILEHDPQSGFRLEAFILFKGSIFQSDVWVQPNGMISLQNERLILEEIPILPEKSPIIVPNAIPGDFNLKHTLARLFHNYYTDEKILFIIYEVLFREALLQAEGQVLISKFKGINATDELVKKFALMIEKNRPVVVLESSQPFIEEIIAKIISKEEGVNLKILPIDFKQHQSNGTNKVMVPTMGNNSLVLLPMHTFSGIDQEERFVFDITTNEAAVFIGCYSFASLPDSLQRVTDLVIRIPEINYGNFSEIFEKMYYQGIPEHLVKNSFGWVGQVLPNDFQQPTKLGLHPEEIFHYIHNRVEERNKKVTPSDSLKLNNLYGLGEAKEIVRDLIADIDAALHGKINWNQVDRGMLIVGPPGTGKTTLARAIARECGIKFIIASASKWSSSEHLGYHLQAIRADFAMARRFAPSILFIDELDSIGSRENGDDKNNYYQTQVVNTLLQEIQGFTPNDRVFIIGATNYEKNIDPALRRAGRLDNVVYVPYPNIEALQHIYRYYLQPYKQSGQMAKINVSELAELSFGLTGADVELFVRGASRRARKAFRKISQQDLLAEILGKSRSTENSQRLTKEEVHRLAVHEAGHALIKILGKSKGTDIAFASIVPQYDGKLGFVANLPSESSMLTLEDYTHMLEVFLAGRAAEEVCFGSAKISSGAGGGSNSDLAKATHLLSLMITRMGFGKSGGLMWLETAGNEQNEEIKLELNRIYGEVVNKLRSNRHLLDKIAGILIEKQEIRGVELLKLLYKN